MPRCRDNYRRRKARARWHAAFRARGWVLNLGPGETAQFFDVGQLYRRGPKLFVLNDAGSWDEIVGVTNIRAPGLSDDDERHAILRCRDSDVEIHIDMTREAHRYLTERGLRAEDVFGGVRDSIERMLEAAGSVNTSARDLLRTMEGIRIADGPDSVEFHRQDLRAPMEGESCSEAG